MKKLKQLDEDIKLLEVGIKKDEAKMEETENEISTLRGSLDSLLDDLKKKLLDGREKKIEGVQKTFQDRKAEIQCLEILVGALRERIETSTKKLIEMRTQQNVLFNESAERWLKGEVESFDESSRALKRSVQRLLAAFHVLRETGGGNVYVEGLGDAYVYLPGLKVFTIRNFDRTIFASDMKPMFDQSDLGSVIREIEEEK